MRSLSLRCAFVVLAAIAMAGCASAAAPDDKKSESACATSSTNEALYQSAIADATVAEPSEIVDTLTAIRPDNTELVRDSAGRVLMVTWTSYAGYDDKVGGETVVGVDVWTTVAPQLKTFCQTSGLNGESLAMRLKQRLGLPPDSGYNRVVELWVSPDPMFRPSPDPEITDTVASLEFPPETPDAYVQWFNARLARSYGADGYPWTRLGYTYDWAPCGSKVGLSEFVVGKGTSVGVASVSTTDEYCAMSR